jgi:hypothetical protein
MNSQINGLVLHRNLSENRLLSNQGEINSLQALIEKKLTYSTELRMGHLWNKDPGPKVNAEKSFAALLIQTQE